MIRKLEVRNFKKFKSASFEFDKHVVIVGPNNCGKTTLLQAVAVWSEVCDRWMSDGSRMTTATREGKYVDITMSRLESLPYKDFRLMWRNQDTQSPITLSLKTAKWEIGFELTYVEQEMLRVRPTSNVMESHLIACEQNRLSTVYVPPFSGLTMPEAKVAPETVMVSLVQDMLHGRGGSVLRNMLLEISTDPDSWRSVQAAIKELFGYELTHPSGVAEIMVGYRQLRDESALDIACGARGFLQVLFIYASLYYSKNSAVIMIDEPDAHLYLALQESVYNRLKTLAQSTDRQLIVVTHSELLMEAARRDLKVLTRGTLESVGRKVAKDVLRMVRVREVLLAQSGFGILYVEGDTDIRILREWARSLGHPALKFLEGSLWRPTASEAKNFASSHFSALQLSVPGLRGILLEDRNGKDDAHRSQRPSVRGLKSLLWDRYEIESYLIHPQALLRFVEKRDQTGTGVARADEYMKEYYGPLYRRPFENMRVLIREKGKTLLKEILGKAQVDCAEEYCHIAGMMEAAEIHPEVCRVLDAVAAELGVIREV